jgi:ABC-2 type transport system permease protein
LSVGRLWPILRREYLERVRSRAFLLATVAAPLLMAGVLLLPAMMMRQQYGRPLRVAVLDASGSLGDAVADALAQPKVDGRPRFLVERADGARTADEAARLKKEVLSGRLDGYLYLPPDALERSAAEYLGRNVSNVADLRLIDVAVEEVMVARRLATQGMDPVHVKRLTRTLDLKTIRIGSTGDEREDRGASALLSIILLMMLYTTVIMWGQVVMTSVIEEKTSRVVEIMVSSIPSARLFAGKLLGVGAAGLTQFLVWAGALAAIGLLGAGTTEMLGDLQLPEASPLVLVAFVVYFLLGYFFYAALFAGIGAAVNTPQEAQTLVFPVFAPLLVGTVCFPLVLQSPDSTLSTALSLLPPLTPLVMFLRITVLTPPWWQIVLSVLLTGLSIALAVWFASRIHRVGILMYGKRPTLPEMMRWALRP